MYLLNNITNYLITIGDPRVKDWILFNPWLIIFIIFSYLYFIFVCGPRFMKNRKPYSLKTFIRCYDIFQIVINYYIVHKLLSAGWFTTIPLHCIPMKYGTDPDSIKLLHSCWWGFLTKLIDLIETGIFVLRKKDQQISFLHLYHHISTVLVSWLFGKNYSDGMSTFIPLINCSVHVIMYTYYFLSTFGPNVRKIIHRYKFLLTIIQMVQFIILICFISQIFLPSCDVDNFPAAIMILNLFINFFLFYNFYKKNYLAKKTR
ncbi:elongation of very long chain fatty acids protein 1-like [Vespa velutina]|uniref:elongation of very long chain fatty acids protein 1-like n=1 Tax=Vespa velutina TaxID=202808 RepID=UPI001FB33525|nr:elongation of very long chain fatty acids protein 1-like [Vespa velutina]